ncbi:MAG: hypothetical protein KDH19_06135, partial [Geminicoccaceae bacterium]|nr:hypothetical protein [Geminicoccaceae bacterium]
SCAMEPWLQKRIDRKTPIAGIRLLSTGIGGSIIGWVVGMHLSCCVPSIISERGPAQGNAGLHISLLQRKHRASWPELRNRAFGTIMLHDFYAMKDVMMKNEAES